MLALLALVPSAFPCAGFVPTDVEAIVAASDTQQAILSRESEDAASATYRVRYAGNATDFAWIIPVPGPVLAVEEGEERLFKTLDEVTAPTWEREVRAGADEDVPDCGCAGPGALKGTDSLGAADRGEFSDSNGVEVVEEGFAGDFAYTVLEAEEADGLLTWLTEHGYDTSVSAPSIASYVEDESVAFRWVAVQLRPELSQPDAQVMLPPLTVRWGRDEGKPLEVRYPSRMASTSMLPEVRTTLWVSGMGAPQLTNDWQVAEDSEDEGAYYAVQATEADADPAALFTELLRANGGAARTYWRTWAGLPGDTLDFETVLLDDPGYLVRFDGLHAPSSQLTDVGFLAGDEEIWDSTRILLPAEPAEEGSTDSRSWALPLGVLGFALRRRFGRRSA
jgi:hypothetical protein